jgi:hypothetical protein
VSVTKSAKPKSLVSRPWIARDERLLHDLVARAPAHHEDVRGEREPALQERPTHHFVDRVVPPDVLARAYEMAVRGEQSRGVEPTRGIEDPL